jgi:hypothetical protein
MNVFTNNKTAKECPNASLNGPLTDRTCFVSFCPQLMTDFNKRKIKSKGQKIILFRKICTVDFLGKCKDKTRGKAL